MDFCGIKINCCNLQDIFRNFNDSKILVTVNAEAIVRAQHEKALKNIINENLASLDGQIPLWLFKLKNKIPIIKISGSDLIYILSGWATDKGYKIYLLGGDKKRNELSVINLRKKYEGLLIDGYSPDYEPYPFSQSTSNRIIDKIQSYKPQILFVGFGMGKQEYWSYDNLEKLKQIGVKLIIGCGGSFDFASGKIKRAPLWVQKIGLESVWRLFQEFKWFRIKRILISLKIFYYYYKYHMT